MMRKLYIFLLLVLMVGLLWWRFPDFFSSQTNQRFIEPWGDGYKAYHAIFYHAEHDTTLSHFNGMNYPYGEHVVPGACQPLFSNGLKILRGWGLNLIPYQRGLLHSFLILGLMLCTLFLYLIFERLKLPPWYALLVAIGLTFLAPQVDRMISHYGLAHPELFPLVFYLLLRWHERPRWGWSLGVGAVVWAYSLIHFYYFALLAFAIVGWVGVRWLWQRDWRDTLAYLGHGLLMFGVPLLFFYAWMLYPDPVTDRNPVPWGFFHYRSHLSGVFTHASQPHWQWVGEHLRALPNLDIEARAYAGMTVLLGLPFVLWSILRQGLQRPYGTPPASADRRFVNYLLVSGGLILVFALGFPFILPGGEKLLPYAGPIQQFRSIGRFAWIFYYAANIAVFYYLYHWVIARRRSTFRWVMLVVPPLVLLFEAYHYNWSKNIALDEVENWEEGAYFTDRPVDYARYQACVPIPYFNIGSGNFWWEPTGWISQKPHTLSMQTGLPLTSAMLTRTSLRQTLNQLQLVTEPYRRPNIFDDFPDDRPLLLFWDDARVHEREEARKFLHLNQDAKPLYVNDWLHLYELPLSSFQTRLARRVAAVRAALDTLPVHADGWQYQDSTAQFYYDDYAATPRTDAYFGAGELPGDMSYWNRLVDTVWRTDYAGELTVSFWQYLDRDRSARTMISWVEYDAETGAERFRWERASRQAVQMFDDRGWGLIEFNVPRQRPDSRIELIVRSDDRLTGPLRIDELLIRPAGMDVGRRLDNGHWWNNRWYPQGVEAW